MVYRGPHPALQLNAVELCVSLYQTCVLDSIVLVKNSLLVIVLTLSLARPGPLSAISCSAH